MSGPSMGTYVAMLRGVNVGAKNRIKMPALAKLFEELGHADVVTYIQSGNVVFKSRSTSANTLARNIEKGIAADLGCEVAVLLRSKAELARLVKANPFLRTKADPKYLHVTFLAEEPDAASLRAVKAYDAGSDEFVVRGRDVCLHCPNGYGTTKINNGFFEKRLQAIATTRNWNSVTKLLELAG
jgi:uncharacterized protein (DUF1697 family)